MEAKILDGKKLSEEIRGGIKERVDRLREKGIKPGLAVILVGNDPASEIYVRNKGKACEAVGIESKTICLPEDTTQEKLEETIQELNEDVRWNGILVQLPLPKHLNERDALSKILPEKDVDGFHVMNAGHLLIGTPGVVPCTPLGAMYMIHQTGVSLSGKNAVVIGRSMLVGKPMALLLLREDCTVTVCHRKTQNLSAITREADILVVAAGSPGMVTGDMIKLGAVVIDVGINRVEGKICGDVDFESASKVAGWITPVPGGVGRMTITMLLSNTVDAAERTM